MDHEPLATLELGNTDDATHSFLWLHGLGDTGHGHADVVEMLDFPDGVRARFVLPHAPSRPVTVNMGMIMPAWYDIRQLGGGQHDSKGIELSAEKIRDLVDQEVSRGVPAERIFVCGFSQGGVVALKVALEYPSRLAGAIGLSTYLADDGSLATSAHDANADLEFFLGHGTHDPMVPFAALAHARTTLENLGHQVTVGTYPMEHSLCDEELADISKWLEPLL
ncbi:MAG: carboxylesterase [Planctomycetes bacterium]|nr:carboxylesterase [Planctomycetota bacterium]